MFWKTCPQTLLGKGAFLPYPANRLCGALRWHTVPATTEAQSCLSVPESLFLGYTTPFVVTANLCGSPLDFSASDTTFQNLQAADGTSCLF